MGIFDEKIGTLTRRELYNYFNNAGDDYKWLIKDRLIWVLRLNLTLN